MYQTFTYYYHYSWQMKTSKPKLRVWLVSTHRAGGTARIGTKGSLDPKSLLFSKCFAAPLITWRREVRLFPLTEQSTMLKMLSLDLAHILGLTPWGFYFYTSLPHRLQFFFRIPFPKGQRQKHESKYIVYAELMKWPKKEGRAVTKTRTFLGVKLYFHNKRDKVCLIW